ncbi:MAG: class I SAM-dependent methyltransferase [Proteobacteria bacterium]|nr:class I SAM-dependent methyltransferase [Pseudomonadota bacterium]
MDRLGHWEGVYSTHREHEVGWYQARPDTSLRLIAGLASGPGDAIIDVGGGASNLVDHLLDLGFLNITVLDISATALNAVKTRLGPRASTVQWLARDITRLKPRGPYKLWHDRAVFHFLTDPKDRASYVSTLSDALPLGAHVIMATFADDGPEMCSNLPVCRYSPEQLSAELGDGFALLESLRETHVTPNQGKQKFIYCCFRRN